MNKKSIVALVTLVAMLASSFCANFAYADTVDVGVAIDTIYELENSSHSGMTTQKIKSPYASGGMYIVNKGAEIASVDDIKTDDISFMVNVPDNGNVKVFIRALFPNGSSNAFYWRWDNSAWQTYAGTYNINYQWLELNASQLSKGLHKFSICRKKSGVCFDAVYVTQDEKATAPVLEGVEMIPEVKDVLSHAQTYIPVIDGNGFAFEAEDAAYDTSMEYTANKTASGGAVIRAGKSDTVAPTPDEGGNLEMEFTSEIDGYVIAWMRIQSLTAGNDSCFTGYDKEKFTLKNLQIRPDYYWTQAVEYLPVKKGVTYKIKYQTREAGACIDQFVVTSLPGFMPDGVVKVVESKASVLVSRYEEPPYSPVAGQHPRVYFTQDDVENLIYKLNHPENAQYKKTFDQYVAENVDIGLAVNDNTTLKIEAKAYYYALFKDKKVGQDAVDLVFRTISTWPPLIGNTESNTRPNGRLITMYSLVYDWCYDLLTEEQKAKLIDTSIATASLMENGWPPEKQPAIVGHAAEAQFLRDIMCFAIATYDERPDIWNFVGGRFYQEYVPVRQWYMKSSIHNQGGNYGVYRHSWDLHAYKLITEMGAPEPFPAKDVAGMDYSRLIYLRRPDGMITLDGDMYNTTPMAYSQPAPNNLLLSTSIAMDPYLKDEYIRVTTNANKNGITRSYGSAQNDGLVIHLIYSEPDLQRASRENLPLSAFYGSPMGSMAARTGWGDTVENPSVVAQMKMDEYWFANHQTPAAGNFALYYKGPLTGQSGVYDIYGSPAFNHYNHHSVASNCLLVYDPNEPLANFDNKPNDGGQFRHNNTSAKNFEELLTNPILKKNTIEGHEIDPKNVMEPDYSYFKGDLTNSYSDKITDYTRSMMFLNLKDETIPAALIVFDKVSVKDPSFKKTWVLHGQTYPKFEKNRTIWYSSPYVNDLGERYTGKMLNDALLPADSKTTKTVIGSEEDGWNINDGVNVLGNTQNTKKAEENTYRLEIATTESKETEYFLNVLQVTDEGNTVYHNTALHDSELFYGASISDRVVFFSKTGDRVSGTAKLKVPAGIARKFMVCDIEAGVWEVTTSEGTQKVTATEDGGVLSFTSNGGEITLTKTNEEPEVLETEELVLDTKKTLYVKANNQYVNQPVECDIVNNRYLIAIDHLAVKMGLKATKEFMKNVYEDEKQGIVAEVRHGSNIMYVNGKEVKLVSPTYFKDGHLMIELRSFAEAFNFIVHYDGNLGMIFLAADPQLKKEDDEVVSPAGEGYAIVKEITGNKGVQDTETLNSTMVADGLTSTQWAANGVDSFFDIELNEEVILENVEIVFAPNGNRTPYFEILISNDGETYTSIYDGKGDPNCDGKAFEIFTFDVNKEFKTKYIRYIGKGSDRSAWNGVREMRFKIGEPLIRWEEKDEYAKVENVSSDGGAVDASFQWGNVTDNNSRTTWAAQGSGRYIEFELSEKESLIGVNVMFNPMSKRIPSFEIQVSEDGKSFKSIYKGKGNGEVEQFTWEEFKFDKSYKAKYVRYVGLGSNLSAWNGVNEIRFIKE